MAETPISVNLAATIRDPEASSTTSPRNSSSSRIERIAKANPLAQSGANFTDRYRIEAVAGVGATSQVLAVTDQVFDRQVAIKFLHEAKAEDPKRLSRFVYEAKMTAALEHPNIAPVYDLDFTEDGSAYFTMRLVQGQSLGELLQTQPDGVIPAVIASVYERVGILLKVLDAVASAHARGIIHRDIKPDNIMVGKFGEVFLVDWGCAQTIETVSAAPRRLVGTPNYMSPEQARGERVDVRSDVYCLGATLFEMLYGRVPVRAAEPELFWKAKRQGAITLPTPGERAGVPRQLQAIVRKAVAAELEERYQKVDELTADLRAWEAGLAISAYRDSAWERATRWHRQHAGKIWAGILVIAVISVLVVMVWGERLKNLATWGKPVLSERFATSDWSTRWLQDTFENSAYVIADGSAVSQGWTANVLWYREPLSGDIAISYHAEMRSGERPGDLSLVLLPVPPGAGNFMESGPILVQLGAYDNSYARIGLPDGIEVQVPHQLVSGRQYAIRVELIGEEIRLLVDGTLLCTAFRPSTYGVHWVGLYGYYPGKSFSDIDIYALGTPERVSALAAGERDLADGYYLRAAEYFTSLARMHAGKDLAEEAHFRAGLAWSLAQDELAAETAWQAVSVSPWRERVLIERLRLNEHQVTQLVTDMPALIAAGPRLRPRVAALWNSVMAAALKQDDRAGIETLLSLRQSSLADQARTTAMQAQALMHLERWQAVVDRCPLIVDQCAEALIFLGRAPEAYRRFSDRSFPAAKALLAMGRFQDVRAMKFPPIWALSQAEYYSFRDPVSGRDSPQSDIRLMSGTAELELHDAKGDYRAKVLLALGWEADVAERPQDCDPNGTATLTALALAEPWSSATEAILRKNPWFCAQLAVIIHDLARGERAAAQARLATLPVPERSMQHNGLDVWIVQTWLAELLGNRGAFERAQTQLRAEGRWWSAQGPWHAAQWLAGKMDDKTYLDQPMGIGVQANIVALKGIQADRAGDTAAAIGHYTAYLKLPPFRRSVPGTIRSAPMEMLLRWRLRELAAAQPATQKVPSTAPTP